MATNPEGGNPPPPDNNGGEERIDLAESQKAYLRQRAGVEDLKQREAVIRYYDEIFPDDPEQKERFAEYLAEEQTNLERSLTLEQIDKIRDPDSRLEERWETIENIVNEIYSSPDNKPGEAFESCFTLEDQIKLTNVWRQVRLGPDAIEISNRLTSIHNVRRTMHNAMMYIESGKGKIEDVVNFMQVHSKEIEDLFSSYPEVAVAFRFFEEVLEQEKVRNDNWIPPEIMTAGWKKGESKVNIRVRERFKRAIANGLVANSRGEKKKYRLETEEGKKQFEKDWPEGKINRAIHLGRAYGAASRRFPEIFSQTRLPGSMAKGDYSQMISPAYEDYVRILNSGQHVLQKFYIGGRNLNFLYFVLTGDRTIFKTDKELKGAFQEVLDTRYVMSLPKEQRDKIPNFIYNLNGITSSTDSAWRLLAASQSIKSDDKKNFGLHIGLANIDQERNDGEIEGTEKEQDAEVMRRKQKIWDLALQRIPVSIFHGLQRAYPGLQETVNKKVFGNGG